MNGKLALGSLGALAGAVVGAAAWAAITAATNFQIGYMAVGVGYLAGYGMRRLGGITEPIFGYVAGAVALFGCVLGNVLTGVIVISKHDHYPFAEVAAATLRSDLALQILKDEFGLMDLVFYGIAVYAGYRTALAGARRAIAAPVTESAPETP
ncbi:MAG TPA: hypothetical protein VMA36_00560 [Candidatus Limnocylindria bacterium]|jgi:hypothetical protein|nr:hypothetical protein [Candidatus Limnocylindria bacterium]